MKIGDKVRINGGSGVFEIIYIYSAPPKNFYAVATAKDGFLIKEFQAEKDLELIPTEKEVINKIKILLQMRFINDMATALGKMLLQRIPPDEVLDMLNNIEEYME